MKAFLDHYGWRWMVLRPEPKVFQKQAAVISAAAGGMKSTNRDMADSLFFWGVPRICRYGLTVRAARWADVSAGPRRSAEPNTPPDASAEEREMGFSLHSDGTFFTLTRPLIKKEFEPPPTRHIGRRAAGLARPALEIRIKSGRHRSAPAQFAEKSM